MRAPRLLLLTATLAALVAGCGGDDENDSPTTQTAATVTETVTVPPPATLEEQPPATEEEPAEPTETAPPDDGVCQDGSGNNIDVIGGDVTCDQAIDVADGYDSQGDRVQEVGEFICEGGNAQTRPIIFTCSGPGGEFTVSEG